MTPEEFHTWVVSVIKGKHLSIRKAEELSKLPLGTIKSWKNAFPKVDSVAKLANGLDLSLDYLLRRTENQYSHKVETFSDATLKIVSVCEKNKISKQLADIIVALIRQITKEQNV